MNNIKVRIANEEDADKIYDLWIKLSEDHMSKDPFRVNIERMQYNNFYVEVIKNEACKVYVAVSNDIIVGFMELYLLDKDSEFPIDRYGYILHTYVEEEYRKSKAFIKMYNAVIKYLRKCNISYLQVDVYKHNTKFYNSIKFFGGIEYKTRFIKTLD